MLPYLCWILQRFQLADVLTEFIRVIGWCMLSQFFSFGLILVTDKVFRGDCSTRQVYEEGAQTIALSVVSGINCKYDSVLAIDFLHVYYLTREKFPPFCIFS